jgi:hypothetical protein
MTMGLCLQHRASCNKIFVNVSNNCTLAFQILTVTVSLCSNAYSNKYVIQQVLDHIGLSPNYLVWGLGMHLFCDTVIHKICALYLCPFVDSSFAVPC